MVPLTYVMRCLFERKCAKMGCWYLIKSFKSKDYLDKRKGNPQGCDVRNRVNLKDSLFLIIGIR